MDCDFYEGNVRLRWLLVNTTAMQPELLAALVRVTSMGATSVPSDLTSLSFSDFWGSPSSAPTTGYGDGKSDLLAGNSLTPPVTRSHQQSTSGYAPDKDVVSEDKGVSVSALYKTAPIIVVAPVESKTAARGARTLVPLATTPLVKVEEDDGNWIV